MLAFSIVAAGARRCSSTSTSAVERLQPVVWRAAQGARRAGHWNRQAAAAGGKALGALLRPGSLGNRGPRVSCPGSEEIKTPHRYRSRHAFRVSRLLSWPPPPPPAAAAAAPAAPAAAAVGASSAAPPSLLPSAPMVSTCTSTSSGQIFLASFTCEQGHAQRSLAAAAPAGRGASVCCSGIIDPSGESSRRSPACGA